jgi:hypothetical protein
MKIELTVTNAKELALSLLSQIPKILSYKGGDIHLEYAEERIGNLVKNIDGEEPPNAFVANLELVNIGEEISLGINEVYAPGYLHDLLRLIQGIKSKLLTS